MYTVDDVIPEVSWYIAGALMAKFYEEAAYWNVAVHPPDHQLLGKRRCGQLFVDITLSFGLHSAPFIFNFIASVVE